MVILLNTVFSLKSVTHPQEEVGYGVRAAWEDRSVCYWCTQEWQPTLHFLFSDSNKKFTWVNWPCPFIHRIRGQESVTQALKPSRSDLLLTGLVYPILRPPSLLRTGTMSHFYIQHSALCIVDRFRNAYWAMAKNRCVCCFIYLASVYVNSRPCQIIHWASYHHQ